MMASFIFRMKKKELNESKRKLNVKLPKRSEFDWSRSESIGKNENSKNSANAKRRSA